MFYRTVLCIDTAGSAESLYDFGLIGLVDQTRDHEKTWSGAFPHAGKFLEPCE